MRLSKNWPGTVYGLVDETGEVQYVGQTRYTLNNRLKRHLNEARRGHKDRRCDWIRACWASGSTVGIILIEADAEWDVAEIRWVAHYRTINPNLLNVTDGGSGFKKGEKKSAETRRKMRDAQKAQWATDDYRNKVVSAIKAERNTPEAKQRLSEMAKAAWQKEEVRETRLSKRGETVKGDEFREKMRKSATNQMADPEARRHLSKKQKEHYAANPEAREKAAEAARRGWADPVKRAARIEAIRKSRSPAA